MLLLLIFSKASLNFFLSSADVVSLPSNSVKRETTCDLISPLSSSFKKFSYIWLPPPVAPRVPLAKAQPYNNIIKIQKANTKDI